MSMLFTSTLPCELLHNERGIEQPLAPEKVVDFDNDSDNDSDSTISQDSRELNARDSGGFEICLDRGLA